MARKHKPTWEEIKEERQQDALGAEAARESAALGAELERQLKEHPALEP